MSDVPRKACNYFGNAYDVPRRPVTDIHELSPGDHIAFPRKQGYWHHAITTDIDQGNMELIEFKKNENKIKVEIEKNCYNFEEQKPFYRVQHDPSDCFQPHEVVRRAEKMVGNREYNLATNNCEHFATECKTGRKNCSQVDTCAKNAARGGGMLATAAIKGAGKFTAKEAVRSGATIASGALGTGVEVGFMSYDIHQARKKKEAGHMTQREFEDTVGTRVSVAANAAIGAIAGAAAGQALIPIPVLGAAVGATVGSVAGNLAGGVYAKVGVAARNKYEENN